MSFLLWMLMLKFIQKSPPIFGMPTASGVPNKARKAFKQLQTDSQAPGVTNVRIDSKIPNFAFKSAFVLIYILPSGRLRNYILTKMTKRLPRPIQLNLVPIRALRIGAWNLIESCTPALSTSHFPLTLKAAESSKLAICFKQTICKWKSKDKG